MTRDLTPTRADLWRLVERYGSIAHTATAIGVAQDDLQAWLSGKLDIPLEHYERLLALIHPQG
jgi:hypothetical protein